MADARPTEVEPRASGGRLRGGAALAGLWSRLEPYLEGNRPRLAAFSVVTLVAGFAEALLLYSVVRAAAAIATEEAAVVVGLGPLPAIDLTVGQVFAVAFALVAVMLLMAVAAARLAARMAVTALTNARIRTFDAFLRSSWDLQSREREGNLQELLTTNAKKVATGVTVLADGITGALAFSVFLATALLISPIAAVTILIGVVVLYLGLRPIIRLTRSSSRQHVSHNARFAVSVTEAAAMVREVRAFDVSRPVGQAIEHEAHEAARVSFVTRFLTQLAPNIYQGAGMLLILIGMLVAYLAAVDDLASLGAVVLLLVRALSNSQRLQGAIQQANEIAPYAEGIREWQQRYLADAVEPGTEHLDAVQSLEMVDVAFAYGDGAPVLTDVNLTIDRNETIGIVGPSGSGKSTLVQLLLRLRGPRQGAYLVNGRPAGDFDASSWASQVAFVPQDNHLFHGTVADNIRFHRQWISDSDIERAARMAHLHDEIVEMVDGYHSVVGSGANALSGGQRQRLGLARALAGTPTVLVLDEPTSALDMRSEELIQQTFAEMKGALTLLIVAHRMTTLQRCDRIMVLGGGRIEDFAAPDELALSNGFYREAMQLSGTVR